MPQSREHGMRTGVLDLFDWDIAAWQIICGEWDTAKNELYMPLGFLTEIPDPDGQGLVEVDRARILFKKPEPTHMEMDLPLVVINRDDVSYAGSREFPITEQYRVPAPGATRISACGTLGWSHYETREQDVPFDLTYTYEVWARDRTIAQMMFQILMSKLPPMRGVMNVTDSLDCVRAYSFVMESTADLTEVSSLVDRVPGFSITIRVQGELTLNRTAIIGTAVTGPTSSTPINPDDPDPGPGGLYATGAVNVITTPISLEAMVKRLHLGDRPFC